MFFCMEAGGIVFDAQDLVRVADSGFSLEVQLQDGNHLRFAGPAAQRLRGQLNLLLEELLRWHRNQSVCGCDVPGPTWTYSWPSTQERAATTAAALMF